MSSAQKRGRICGRSAFIRREMLGARKSWLSFQEAELDEKRKMARVNIKLFKKDEEKGRLVWGAEAGGHGQQQDAAVCIFVVHSCPARLTLPIPLYKAGIRNTEIRILTEVTHTAGGSLGVQIQNLAPEPPCHM